MKKMTKLLCIALCALMLLSLLPVASLASSEKTVYLEASEDWKKDNARFAVYYFKDNGAVNGWVDMVADGNYYKATVSSDMTIIFCRMNPATTDNNWDNKWEQTGDLALPTDDKNCFVQAAGTWTTKGTHVEVVSYDYYVCGQSELCGSSWLLKDPNCGMSKVSANVYEKTFEGIAAGSYIFKVNDGTWDKQWNANGTDPSGGNLTVEVPEASNVTIRLDLSTNQVTWVLKAASGGDVTPPAPKPITDCYVAGNAGLCGEEWAVAAAANKMTAGADGKFTITYTDVAAGDHKFKVTDGTWDRCWGGEGDLADGDGNFVLKLAVKSDVTITFDPEAKKVSVSVTAKEDASSDNEPTPPVPGTPYTVTVYFQAPDESWGDAINAWIWTGEGENLPGYEDYHITWPGKAVLVDTADPEWYKLEVTTDAAAGFKFIFSGNGQQTADLAAAAQNATVWYVGDTMYTSKPVASSDTGDSTPIMALIALMSISAAAMVVLAKKKAI